MLCVATSDEVVIAVEVVLIKVGGGIGGRSGASCDGVSSEFRRVFWIVAPERKGVGRAVVAVIGGLEQEGDPEIRIYFLDGSHAEAVVAKAVPEIGTLLEANCSLFK